MEYQLIEKSETDWYGLRIDNDIFHAVGDPDKLQFLLEKFKEIASLDKAEFRGELK